MESFTHMRRFDKWLLFVLAVLELTIIFGPLLSFGAIFVTMMDIFQTNRAETAAVQSIFIGVTFTFGLVSGTLVSRFGPTMMILVASVLVPLGFSVSYFVKQITYLYVTIGVISGSIRDMSGSYKIVLVTVTSVQAIAAILFTVALITNRQRKRKIQQKSIEIFVTTRL